MAGKRAICVYRHDLDGPHAINDVTKKKRNKQTAGGAAYRGTERKTLGSDLTRRSLNADQLEAGVPQVPRPLSRTFDLRRIAEKRLPSDAYQN